MSNRVHIYSAGCCRQSMRFSSLSTISLSEELASRSSEYNECRTKLGLRAGEICELLAAVHG